MPQDPDVKIFEPGEAKKFQEETAKLSQAEKKEQKPKEKLPKPETEKETPKQTRIERIKETVKEKAKALGKKAKEFGKYTGGKIKEGLKEGAQETVKGYGESVKTGARFVTAAPIRGARAIYGKTVQPALRRTKEGFFRPRGISRHRMGDEGAAYRGIALRSRGMGRLPRASISKGVIKPYWSKKLKKLARQQIRRHGTEEGLSRTRHVAQMLGWKMQ